METSRVIVVDDSRFMRKIITDIIEADAQFTVVGTAENGKDALDLVDSVKPDIVTLDLEMPEMNGIDALQAILMKHNIPIIMLSGISESNTQDTIRALQYGAFDFIRKPTSVGANANDIVSTGELLIEKMKIAALTKRRKSIYKPIVNPLKETKQMLSQKTIITELTNSTQVTKLSNPAIDKVQAILKDVQQKKKKNEVKDTKDGISKLKKDVLSKSNPVKQTQSLKSVVADKKVQPPDPVLKEIGDTTISQIVAIGTSTGGPRALHEVISNIPAGFSAPIVVVQHMPPKFTHSLAQRLDHFSNLNVVEATDQMELRNGQVYIAPGGYHMKVMKKGIHYVIALSTEPPRHGHRPSVDVLYESLASFKELERHVVIMTGMGSDGAQGMKALHENGVKSTIAESEQSCVVYGMPRSAVELGIVEKVLPLSQIAPEIVRKVMKRTLN